MKTSIRLVLCAIFFSLSLSQTQAQIIDSLPYFKDIGHLWEVMDARLAPALLELDNRSQLLSKSFQMRSRLSSKVKIKSKQYPVRVDAPLTLEHDGKCFQIACAKEKNCSTCGLMWWDRNGDGKVQPKRELRCVCKESKTQCEMRGRKKDC